MELSLVVDTSIFGTYLSLKDFSKKNKDLLWSSFYLERNGSAQALTRMLNQGLKEISLDVNSIKKIFVSSGPGSFTGIKIGIAWCQGLAVGVTPKDIHSYSSIVAIAKNLKEEKNIADLNLLLPVTKTHGFLISLGKDETTKLINVESSESKESFLNSIRDQNNFIVIKWPGVEPVLEEGNINYSLLPVEEIAHHSISGASAMIALIDENLQSEVFVTPNYMRKSTAEERLEKMEGK